MLVAALLLSMASVPAWGQEPDVDLGVYGGPLRFEAPDGAVTEVVDEGRYVDVVEFRLAADGDLVLINELPIEEYVAGIAEMPARWPLEALKAQAVAARTYAWWQAQGGVFERRGRGYDICASTACQVFAGRRVVETPELGPRWQQAVDETAGEVLLYAGEPILARYFSTSGGSTRNNEVVYPSEGPRPYLKGIPDPEDAISPLHAWRVVFPRTDFDEILSAGQTLRAAVPVASIELVPAVAGSTDRVRVTSTDGEVAEVSASQFRAFVSGRAQRLFPDRYPSERGDGRSLPTTLPSSRMSFTVTDHEVIVDGRGWGHGVGMSQWGAYGRAEAGQTYEQILNDYYTGVDGPVAAPGLPETIRVGIDAIEAAGSWTVELPAPTVLRSGGSLITERALGTWRVTRLADRTVRLTAPAGYGAPLVVAPAEPSRAAPYDVELLTVETVLNKTAELFLEVRDEAGQPVLARPLGVRPEGRHSFAWDLDDQGGANVEPGTYWIGLRAVDEDGEEVTGSAEVEVREVSPGPAATSLLAPLEDAPTAAPAVATWLVAGAAALAVGAALGAAVPIRPRRRAP